MPLFLIRHADAVFQQDDQSRRLSQHGRSQAKQLVKFFAHNQAFAPMEVWHSPLVRARETAGLLLAGLKLDSPLIETAGLLPEDDPEQIASRLAGGATEMNVAVVGHEPYMSALATLLVCGRLDPIAFQMRTGAVLALERTGAAHKKTGHPQWGLRWHVTPELLP